MIEQTRDTHSDRKTVIVTGTSSGIGLATAVALARAGWNAVATMRNLDRASALKDAAAAVGLDLEIRHLDVTDSDSIRSAVDGVVGAHGRLDAIVNNAGAASIGTVEQVSIEEFRSAMEVNYFGVVGLTKAAMPHLRLSGGRAVTISSVGGVVGQPFNEAYCAAKFAVEGFMEALHPVARTVGVGISLIEPGAVSSEFIANAGLDPESMLATAGPYRDAVRAYLERTLQQFDSSLAQTSDDIARVVLECLDTADPALRFQTSDWSRDFVGTKLLDTDGSRVTGMTSTWVS